MTSPEPPAREQVAEAAEYLVSQTDIARRCGVTRAAVSNCTKRHSEFPAAVITTGEIALYYRPDIDNFLAGLPPARPANKISDDTRADIAARRARGEPRETIAASTGVSPSTVYRITHIEPARPATDTT